MVPKIRSQKTAVLTLFLQIFLQCQGQSQLTPGTCGMKPASCPSNSKYRSIDGSCNNLQNPVWGMPDTRYGRLLGTNYANGTYPTAAKSGNPLPNSRNVSMTVYPDLSIEDPNYTLVAMQYGQVIAHDMSLTMSNNEIKQQSEKCCSADGQLLKYANDPEYCYPVMIPKNDPVYEKFNIQCFEFDRTGTDRDFNCSLPNKPPEQLSAVTHYLDLSITYGQNLNVSKDVRSFKGGKLKFEERKSQDWLPRNKNVTGVCTVESPKEPCYMAGDVRVNQNPQLTVLQTIFLRDHNRIADILAKINSKWDDEKLFQETRKICIAQHQNIVYYEWLPIFLGEKNVIKKGITYKKNGYINDYNSSVNPSVLNEHATAAFRLFHSNIVGKLYLVTEDRYKIDSIRLSDWFNRPKILENSSVNFDDLTRGFVTQHQFAADEYHDKEITNNWIRPIGKKVGQDLKAICIQRNRDHGLASYNDLREYCGLKRANKFEDFEDVMSKDNIAKLKTLYEVPDDVDVTVGGSLEKLEDDSLAGHTFLCIITEQFYRTRVGDRYFFENSGETGFSLPQLLEIKKTSISRLLCDNTNVKSIQPMGFKEISDKNNIVNCTDLPSINLTLWKE